jgi:hypothetical protein
VRGGRHFEKDRGRGTRELRSGLLAESRHLRCMRDGRTAIILAGGFQMAADAKSHATLGLTPGQSLLHYFRV